jgi:hypothetical protein
MIAVCQRQRAYWKIPAYVALIALGIAVQGRAQDRDYLAIIPALHDPQHSSDASGSIQLTRQSFVIFLFRDAAVVSSETEFLNTAGDSVEQEVSLPSTGHDENGDAPGGRLSNGILSVRMWVEGERVTPVVSNVLGEESYSVRVRFDRFQRHTVKALFWLQTSREDIDATPGLDTAIIPDGRRGFMIDLSHAAIWKDMIDRISVTVVFREGLQPGENDLHATPESYDVRDSTLQWEMRAIEPSSDQNIEIAYASGGSDSHTGSTLARLSRYITGRVYDELTAFVRSQNE